MPTVLFIHGWRLFFYANERNEPPHIHARKGDVDCKYWLHVDSYEVVEDHAYGMSPAERRAIRKIVYENFEYLVSEYEAMHKGAKQ